MILDPLLLVSFFMDSANHTVFRDAFQVGENIEKQLTEEKIKGFYWRSHGSNYTDTGVRFTIVLRWLYGVSCALFLIFALFLIYKY